jgi:hypothetical protein
MTAHAARAASHIHVHLQEVYLMATFSQLEPLWVSPIAVAVIALGLMLVWRGLRGGRDGNRALLGQRIDMLHRIEGFRLTVFGLVLIGAGAAVIWRAQWLLLLALGIGFVEILESSALIAVWRWGRRRGATRQT